ncbi:MAG: ATP-binding protein [Chlorobi bacterium]|nr:ATP-binding protein [Chlorobiota bacterium]
MFDRTATRRRIPSAAIATGAIAFILIVKLLAALIELPNHVRLLADAAIAVVALAMAGVGWLRYCAVRDQLMLAQKLVRNSPDCMLVLSEQGTILDANERSRDVLGYEPSQLVGNHVRAIVHPDHRRACAVVLAQLAVAPIGRTVRVELHLVHRSERAFPAELAATLEPVGRKRYVLVSLRDLTERARQERKVRRVLHTLDRIVRTIPHTILIYDIDNKRFVYARVGHNDDLGFDSKTLTSTPIDELSDRIVHPDDRQVLGDAFATAMTLGDGESVPCIYRRKGSDGQLQWRRIRIAVFERDSSGTPTRLLIVGENITELVQTRTRLDRISDRLRIATEGAGIGAWEYDLHRGEFIWDEQTYHLHELPTTLVGKRLVARWRGGVHRHDMPAVLAAAKSLLRGHAEKVEVSYRFFTATGERKYFRVVASVQTDPVSNERIIVGIVIDETQIRLQQQQQEKLQHLLEESQRMAHMASWEIDPVTLRLTCSSELWNLLGVTPSNEPLALSDYQQNIYPDDRQLWLSTIFNSITERRGYVLRYRIIRRSDGQVRWMQCHGEPVICGNKVALLRGTVQDITEQYEQEQELIRTREEALKASRVKSEFLANMSHEIRTPMNAILGFASLLDQTVTDPLQREYIAAIRSGGQTLLQLINDILDLSKLEAGKMRLQPEPTELQTFVEEVRMFLRERASSKGLELRTELVGTLPTAVELDVVRMRQILFNLVGNAIKFTERGQVTVRVFGSPDGDGTWRLVFEVEDTGIGIPADQLDAIFEAFQQVEGQSTRKYGGTGLGLSICKRLTELMGGTISVRSTVGSGSVFTVVLPSVPEVHVEGIPTRQAATTQTVSFDGAVVVVVDDVESNRALLRSYLEHHGAVVHEAAGADDAERLVALVQPAAVFTDIQMPGRSGIELAAALRRSEQWKNLPLVAVTASPLSCEQDAALFDGVILKPVTLETFLSVATSVLPHRTLDELTQSDDSADDDTEPLSDEHRTVLRTIAESEWRRAVERMSSADIEAFIAALERSDASSSRRLRRYIEQVRRAYEQFDIVGLRQHLEDYRRLVMDSSKVRTSEIES